MPEAPAVEEPANGKADRKLPEIAAQPEQNGKDAKPDPDANGKELVQPSDFKNVSEAEGQQKVSVPGRSAPSHHPQLIHVLARSPRNCRTPSPCSSSSVTSSASASTTTE